MRKTIYYIFVLIALYLVFVHASSFSTDLGAAKSAGTGFITALQGR